MNRLTKERKDGYNNNNNSSNDSSWSFMQGFLIGQLSVIIMICAFIKYFIFGDSTSSTADLLSERQRKQNKLRKKRSSVLRNPPPLTTATILSKTYYNVHSHQPESLDW